jgi:hypothetical protein
MDRGEPRERLWGADGMGDFSVFLGGFCWSQTRDIQRHVFHKVHWSYVHTTYIPFFRAIAWNCVNYSKTCIYIQVRTMTCNCTQLHKKKRAHNYTQWHAITQIHTYIHTSLHTYMPTNLHTYIPDTLKYSGSRMLGPGDQPSKGLLWWRVSF